MLTRDDLQGLNRHRRSPEVWSVAEYAGHTADAMEFIARRTQLLLTEDDSELPRFGDPNARDYTSHDIRVALMRVSAACIDLAATFDSAATSDLDRTGHNALGKKSLRDTAAYAVHEAGHHLHDIQLAGGLTS